MRTTAVVISVVPCLLLAACAGLGQTVKRPAVQVADVVNDIDRSLVVGTWQCHELNPLPDAPRVRTVYEFKADGTLATSGRSEQMQQGGTPVGLGPMQITGTGTWKVDGQDIVVTGTHAEAKAADGNSFTSAIASIATSIANSTGLASNTSRVNVLRLSDTELVMRSVGIEDPPVIACSR